MFILNEVRNLLQKGISTKLKLPNRNATYNNSFLNANKPTRYERSPKNAKFHSSLFKGCEMKNTPYDFKLSLSNEHLLKKADDLNKKINSYGEIEPNLKETIRKQLRASWTYNSNAIEGNSLSLGDTIFFLEEGLTVEGKRFKDYLATKNHAEAIDFIYNVVTGNRPISAFLIKQINDLILLGVDSTFARDHSGRTVTKKAAPGEFKQFPNHVLLSDGTIHQYVKPRNVPAEIDTLFSWINTHLTIKHPIVTASVAHYNLTRIHPFDDGNGRTSRILMNLILMYKEYPPAIIKNEKSREYLTCLRKADNEGDLNPFTTFVANSLIETQELILTQIEKLSLKGRNMNNGINIK